MLLAPPRSGRADHLSDPGMIPCRSNCPMGRWRFQSRGSAVLASTVSTPDPLSRRHTHTVPFEKAVDHLVTDTFGNLQPVVQR